MKSMTGYGRGANEWSGAPLTVEVTSVNRRNLETSTSLPRDCQALEPMILEMIREVVRRGKVHVSVSLGASPEGTGLNWDEAAVSRDLKRIRSLAFRENADEKITCDFLLKLILLHRVEPAPPGLEAMEGLIRVAVGEALAAFDTMRSQEGEALEKDLRERAANIRQAVAEVRSHASDAVSRYRELLMARLRQAGLELELEDERVLREIAIFADKVDITEELTRLNSHLDQFEETLSAPGGTAIGRKLEFITQEMHREVNTIGAKGNHIDISRRVIEAKNEIERIREQVQNVE